MKRLHNTLFVLTQGAWLAKERENVVLRVDGGEQFRIPIHNLDGIVCFGNVGVSPFLLGKCAEAGVTISFLSYYGRFLARVVGPVSGNVLLRREQYRRADDESRAVDIARRCVAAKIANCRTVIGRAARDHADKIDHRLFQHTLDRLTELGEYALDAADLHQLRGAEGEAAAVYFRAFPQLITTPHPEFNFEHRNKRPPRDPVNALLSFLYVLLAHDVRSALEAVGLDPQVGFLHRDRPGRHGLALDIMEEFRPVLADRVALTLLNRKQISPQGFTTREGGSVIMDEQTRKTVLTAWQERKHDVIQHPVLKEKIPVGLLPHAQALLLARTLRGDLDQYPPFIWR